MNIRPPAPPEYTQIPNVFLDNMAEINPAEFCILMLVCRKTYGWHKEKDRISLSQFERLTGMSRATVKKAIQEAMEHGLLGREDSENGYVYFLKSSKPSTQELSPITHEDQETLPQEDVGGLNSNPPGGLNSNPTKETITKENISGVEKAHASAQDNSPRTPQEQEPLPGVDLEPACAGMKPAKRSRKAKKGLDVDTDDKLDPEEQKKAVEARADMFSALSLVLCLDPRLCGGRIGALSKQLCKAGYTGKEILGWYDVSNPTSPWRKDWRGRSGEHPNESQLRATVKLFADMGRVIAGEELVLELRG